MISLRYTWPVTLLLLLALIPTVIHNYLQLTTTDGRSVQEIAVSFSGFDSTKTARKPYWGKHTFDSPDWIERYYSDGHGNRVRLFVARSFDHKGLYHHPELALSYGLDLRKQGIAQLSEIPVHVLQNTNTLEFAGYVLLYDDKFIKNPIRHQIGDSLNMLVNPRAAMTLFYVSQPGVPVNYDFKQTNAAKVLVAAITDFLALPSAISFSQNCCKIQHSDLPAIERESIDIIAKRL